MRSLALSALTVPALSLVAALSFNPAMAREAPSQWLYEWGATDFSKSAVSFDEIMSGGPPKDGIPSIDDPVFATAAEIDHLADTEPVISVLLGGEHRAYPLQILMWHEIVNDTVGGVPVSVTFCPLCNSAVVYDRRGWRRGAGFRHHRQAPQLRPRDVRPPDRELVAAVHRRGDRRRPYRHGAQAVAVAGRILRPLQGARWCGLAGPGAGTRRRPRLRREPLWRVRFLLKSVPLPGRPAGGDRAARRVVVVDGEAWSLDLIRAAAASSGMISSLPGSPARIRPSTAARSRTAGTSATLWFSATAARASKTCPTTSASPSPSTPSTRRRRSTRAPIDRRLIRNPQAPGARSARLATRHSARGAVAPSGPAARPLQYSNIPSAAGRFGWRLSVLRKELFQCGGEGRRLLDVREMGGVELDIREPLIRSCIRRMPAGGVAASCVPAISNTG